MVSLAQLWLPILLSAIGIFFSSSLVHMVLKWHNSDYFKLPNEEAVRATLRAGNPAPGQYIVPYCKHGPEMNSDEMKAKFAEGPVGMLLLRKPGAPHMGGALGAWFVLCLVVSVFAGYLASVTIAQGADALHVFRVVATIAFLSFAGGAASDAIWMGVPWRATIKYILDALIYGAVSGAVFAWLWPHA